jgi:hypothetical protein
MSNATTHKNRGAAAAMSGAACAFLPIPLRSSAADLSPGLRFVGALTPVRHLANQRLVHQATVYFGREYRREFDCADFLSACVHNRYIHL